MKSRIAACASLFFLLAAPFSCAQTSIPLNRVKSCRDFVQGFYDWYLKEGQSTYDLALKNKSSALSPELLHALREDYAAQANVPEEIVGLDGDPFLNSQDPSERFVVGDAKLVGDKCLVVVRGVSSGKKREYVEPELARRNGRWVFVNFHYGTTRSSSDENLVRELKALREDRRKYPQ
jgi:hypothetical protein